VKRTGERRGAEGAVRAAQGARKAPDSQGPPGWGLWPPDIAWTAAVRVAAATNGKSLRLASIQKRGCESQSAVRRSKTGTPEIDLCRGRLVPDKT